MFQEFKDKETLIQAYARTLAADPVYRISGDCSSFADALDLATMQARTMCIYNPGVWPNGWYIPAFGGSIERKNKVHEKLKGKS